MTKIYEKLTADWKAGKLHKRFDEPKLFYCKTDNGIEILKTWGYKNLEFLSMADEVFEPVDDVQVLAHVPTYDEYKAMQKELAELKEKIKKREELIQCLGSNIDELDVKKSVLIIENNKLRGLLKECKEELEYHSELIFCELESDNSKIEFKHLLTHINAVLGGSEVK